MLPRIAAFLLVFLGVPGLAAGRAAPGAAPTAAAHSGPEKLRQTGQAAGSLREVSKALLCEQAEEQAWELVWASCPKRKQVLEAVASGCITTDYQLDPAGDGVSRLTVEVQVEYHCR